MEKDFYEWASTYGDGKEDADRCKYGKAMMIDFALYAIKNHGDIGDIGDVVRNLCCENPDININNYLYMDKNDLTKKVGSKRNCMNCGKSEYSQ